MVEKLSRRLSGERVGWYHPMVARHVFYRERARSSMAEQGTHNPLVPGSSPGGPNQSGRLPVGQSRDARSGEHYASRSTDLSCLTAGLARTLIRKPCARSDLRLLIISCLIVRRDTDLHDSLICAWYRVEE